VEAPASGPHFLSVGGTELFLKPSTGALQLETAWAALGNNPQFSGASGGGVSTIFDEPSYQKNLKGAISTGRNVPDLSFDGDPATGASWFVSGAFLGPLGGTSHSSPIFGAALTELNERKGREAASSTRAFTPRSNKVGTARRHEVLPRHHLWK
jgi:subtilase family serine protease